MVRDSPQGGPGAGTELGVAGVSQELSPPFSAALS